MKTSPCPHVASDVRSRIICVVLVLTLLLAALGGGWFFAARIDSSPAPADLRTSAPPVVPAVRQTASLHQAIAAARHAPRVLTEHEQAQPANRDVRGLAANPTQDFTVSYLDDGVRLQSGDATRDWQFGMRLAQVGVDGGAMAAPAKSSAFRMNGIRAEYQRGDITEWYENREEGLEHGFDIARRPAGASADDVLRLTMKLDGMTTAMAGDEALLLKTADGVARLRYSGLKVWDATGAILPARFQSSDDEISILVADAGATYPITVDPLVGSFEREFTATDAAATDWLGYSVALSGDTAVVGMPLDDSGASTNVGRALVFFRTGTTWVEQAQLFSVDVATDDQFGAAVAIDGNTIAVAAPTDDHSSRSNPGSVYIYTRSGTTWSFQAKLIASDAATDDLMGGFSALDISGDTVAVGAYSDDTAGGTNSGSVYVFVRNGTTWSQQARISASNATGGVEFGTSVAIDGDTIVAGADNISHGPSTSFAGSVWVFTRSGSTWSQRVELFETTPTAGHAFGASVDIHAGTIIVGVPGRNSGTGAAYVYAGSGGSWSSQGLLTTAGGASGDSFGTSVAVNGDVAVVGQSGDFNGNGDDAGSTIVFQRNAGVWTEQTTLLSSDSPSAFAYFGISVDVSGDTVLSGASRNAVGAFSQAGSAFVHRLAGATAPEIAVEQPAGTNIADGGSQSFGSVSVGANTSLTFTIRNTGNANLTGLTITKDGTHSADFTVTANPTAPVSGPSGTTMFTVRFAPGGTGARTAAIHIANNDSNENPFDINLSGTGAAAATPEIAVEQPAGTNIADAGSQSFGSVSVGSNTSLTFTIRNTGNANLTGLTITKDGTHSADFTVTANPVAPVSGPSGTTTFTVRFAPGGTGARTAAIHIANNDSNENPFDINLSGTGAAAGVPEIAVEQPAGTNIADAGSKSFGSVAVGANTSLTFTIRNTGNANLTGLTITKDGTHSADFTVTASPVAPVSGPSGTTAFTVQFAPSATGTRTAAIHIANNDSNENPFDINLSGTATAAPTPEIAVEQPAGTNIADAGSKAFGSVTVGSSTSLTFTIRNTGNANLTGLTITKDGANSADFTVTANPAAPVSGPSGTTTFIVQFAPSGTGARTAAIHIASNDGDENPFDINLSGTGIAPAIPEIAVEQPSATNIVDGGSRSFGGIGVGANAFLTFTIRNSGGATLSGISITKDGAHSGDFTVTASPSAVAGPGGSTSFIVRFTPSALGARTAAIHIASNDGDESPYDINLSGTGLATNANLSNLVSSIGALNPVFASATTSYTQSVTNAVTSVIVTPTKADADASITVNGAAVASGTPSGAIALNVGGTTVTIVVTAQDGVTRKTYLLSITRAAIPDAKAHIYQPVNGSTLTSTSLALAWTQGVNVTSYLLYVGTTSGGSNILAQNMGTALSRTVTVPAGVPVYVTLYSLIRGVYQANYYYFNGATPERAVLVSPANGSTLTSGTLNLQWTPGVGVSRYTIHIGSAYAGYDLAAVDAGTALSRTFTVPQDGGPIYVTIWSVINGAFQSNQYWFTTAQPAGNRPAQIIDPANTSTLADNTPTFTWSGGIGVTKYILWVGSNPDGYDLYNRDEGTGTSRQVNVPGDGRRIHVTLHCLIGGAYQSNSYWFTTPSLPDGGAAQITSPANGSTLADASLALTWSAAAGATQYSLLVGSSPGGADIYNVSQGTALARTVTVPTDGRVVYVTLRSLINNAWKQTTAWFITANLTPKRALITSPVNDTTLTAAATTFTWGGGVGVSSYQLRVGSNAGAYDLWLSTESSATTSRTVTLPTDGRKVHVTLYSLIGGVYYGASYIYTAHLIPLVKAALLSPTPGSTLDCACLVFVWDAGQGATGYRLSIGRKPGGTELYNGNEGTRLYRTVTTLPYDGSPFYVTLWSLLGGTWQKNEYMYTSWLAP